MKSRLLLLPFILGLSIAGFSQAKVWTWGNSHCILNKADSSFLVDVEKSMWKYEEENSAFVLFEGFHGSGGYRVRVSKFQMEMAFADTAVAKLRFSKIAELLTVWDIDADTCWVIGFEPMVIIKRSYRYYKPSTWLDTTCYVHIPL